jgi:hypothetical protein
MADFTNLDVLEELQARLVAELEPLVRYALAAAAAAAWMHVAAHAHAARCAASGA